jgi:hypothetical protein
MDESAQDQQQESFSLPSSPSPSQKTFGLTSIIAVTTLILSISSQAFNKTAYFHCNLLLILIYTITFFILNIYNYKKKHTQTLNLTWHQLLHWLGVVIVAYIMSLFINTGVLTNQQGGHVLLTLIAITFFTIGLYDDVSFLLTGIGIIASLFVHAHAYPNQPLINTSICVIFTALLYLVNLLKKNKK